MTVARGFVLLLFVIGLLCCQSGRKISDINFSGLYSLTGLLPEITVYQTNDTLAVVTFTVNRKELLYKHDTEKGFTARLRAKVIGYPTLKSSSVIDSLSVEMSDSDPDHPQALSFSMTLKTPAQPVFYFLTSLIDLNRQQQHRSWVKVDKSHWQSRVFFRLKDDRGNTRATPFLRSDDSVIIESNHRPQRAYVRTYHRQFPVAPPPFAVNIPVQFNYRADSIRLIDYSTGMSLSFAERGFYHLQFDTSVKAGLTLFRFSDDFPRLTSAQELIEPLRYITNNNEYERLRHASDKKLAVDRFWLELSGSQERARTLIRKYYTRVQRANQLFSTHQEGWQTDRGMIYIVFGPPATVYVYPDREEWGYGTYGYSGVLNFTFEKIYNPFSENDYLLRRSPAYEQPFFRAVTRWREGVVENE